MGGLHLQLAAHVQRWHGPVAVAVANASLARSGASAGATAANTYREWEVLLGPWVHRLPICLALVQSEPRCMQGVQWRVLCGLSGESTAMLAFVSNRISGTNSSASDGAVWARAPCGFHPPCGQ